MLFNSPEFVVFFLLVFALYWALPFRGQNWLLLISSYVFYGWWGFFVPGLDGFGQILPALLLLISSAGTHACALGIDRAAAGSRRRDLFFWAGLTLNLGLLGYFKYCGFFMENLEEALAAFGMKLSWPERSILLPAGISFYSFQSVAYLVDVHGGSDKPARRWWDFALFHAYFPQLVAGPIERTRNLMPQLMKPRTLEPEQLWTGLQLIIIGYVKKVAIADAIAPITEKAFDPDVPQTGLGLLLGIYLFALQIYGDFSGYTDIARGVSRLLGVNLMLNFRQPYFSRNITEFWERWHISLSTWLRDYVFVPLCRIFRGRRWMAFNLFITMMVSGIWHGASWNFVMWGALLGLMLVIHKWWAGPKAGKHPRRPATRAEWFSQLGGMFLTFHGVCLTLVFVKTRTLEDSWLFLRGLFGGGAETSDLIALAYLAFYGGLVAILDFNCWWRDTELPVSAAAPSWRRGLVYGTLLTLLAFLGELQGRSFVYFQF